LLRVTFGAPGIGAAAVLVDVAARIQRDLAFHSFLTTRRQTTQIHRTPECDEIRFAGAQSLWMKVNALRVDRIREPVKMSIALLASHVVNAVVTVDSVGQKQRPHTTLQRAATAACDERCNIRWCREWLLRRAARSATRPRS
jgi:hypothetical protein